MIDPETMRKARELKVAGLADALEMVTGDPSYVGISVAEGLKLVVDYAWEAANQKSVASLIKGARLRLPEADLSNIDYEGRLDRDVVLALGTSQFVATATDVTLQGFAGTGKSHLACALAKQACKHGIRSLYTRMPDMLAYLAEKIEAGWPETKVVRHYAGYRLLVVDDFMLHETNAAQTHFLIELMEVRHDSASTIWCSQYGTEDWHARLGGGASAESILDKIVHNRVEVLMGDVNMRERLGARARAMALS